VDTINDAMWMVVVSAIIDPAGVSFSIQTATRE
jgi:hypothetical protein